MSWDRVIQDSDEDEPLMEDDVSTSIEPRQDLEHPIQQHRDITADYQPNYPMEHTTAQNTSTEPQLGVNFDQFLQSQEAQQAALTLSQQRREERWIPSTSEGGGGSIGANNDRRIHSRQGSGSLILTRLGTGAMMTEIGLAQQRLLDDDASSAGQRLPSTATPYSSEISQPGSFPTAPPYRCQQTEETAIDGFVYAQPGQAGEQDVSYEATQLVAPVHAHVYDYSTPAASTHIDSPVAGSENMATFSTSVQQVESTRAHPSQKTIQRSKSLQSGPYSPHDTEPLSSVVSPHLSRAKSDNTKSGLMSPHSPAETYDELSLPALAVEVSSVKTKRGRPKKQSMPEDDEDDELAIPQESEPDQSKSEKKRPGRPAKVATNDTAGADDGVATSTGDANAPVAPEKLPGKETKKTKIKRSKTADAAMQKTHASIPDDDVIWVDSKPIQADTAKDQNHKTSTIPENNPPEPLQPATTTSTEDNTQSDETPAPKKRGRKRKTTTEQLTTEVNGATKENQPPETPSNTTTAEKDQSPSTTALEPEAKETTDPTTLPTAPNNARLQTPQKNSEPETDPSATKRPGQHSPISSTSKVPYRVGLSKRARIAPLLKVVRK